MMFLSEKISRVIYRLGETTVAAFLMPFDRVRHKEVLSKLIAFGVGDEFARFVLRFLNKSSVRVFIHFPPGIFLGFVPHSSLFVIFINDLLKLNQNPIYFSKDYGRIWHTPEFANVSKLSVTI